MKNHDSYDTRPCRPQRQLYRDRNGGSHSQLQHREFRRRPPERRRQPDVLPDVDPDAEWQEYCNELWLP